MNKVIFERLVNTCKLSDFDLVTAKMVIRRIETSHYIDQEDFLQLSYLFIGMNSVLSTIIGTSNSIETNDKLRSKVISSRIMPRMIKEYCEMIESKKLKDGSID
jgi:hypothetical protein